jgi:hypothetical protein
MKRATPPPPPATPTLHEVQFRKHRLQHALQLNTKVYAIECAARRHLTNVTRHPVAWQPAMGDHVFELLRRPVSASANLDEANIAETSPIWWDTGAIVDIAHAGATLR